MSIKRLVEDKLAELREMIAVWDNPTASQEEKGKVLASLLSNESKFWAEVAKRATAPRLNKKIVAKTVETVQVKPEPAAATRVVAAPKTSVSTVARPVPAKPVPATAPARTLKVQPVAAGTSVFASMLNGAAKEIGLEDHTPLAKLRGLIKKQGRQTGQYWAELREILGVVLKEKAIQDVSDWKLLIAKMKEEPFVSGKKGEAFLALCPKEGVEDLLLADDGLWHIVEALKTGGEINNNTPFHIGFMIDACVVVGKEAKELLIDCKQAVNHMKQTGFIARDHWLVQKVAAMKAPAPPQVAEAVTTEVSVEKPESLGPKADAQFEQTMMFAAGEIDILSGIPDISAISEAELEILTAPSSAVQ